MVRFKLKIIISFSRVNEISLNEVNEAHTFGLFETNKPSICTSDNKFSQKHCLELLPPPPSTSKSSLLHQTTAVYAQLSAISACSVVVGKKKLPYIKNETRDSKAKGHRHR